MNNAHSQFLIVVGDICAAATLAGLWVEVQTDAGARLFGTPAPIGAAYGVEEVDDTGYQQTVTIGDGTVNLDEIVQCTIRAPQDGAG
jgi:hypothetical protein